MSDQRQFSFTITMKAPDVDCAMQSLALLADHQKKTPGGMVALPNDVSLPADLSDALKKCPFNVGLFSQTLFDRLRENPVEADYLAAISWEMSQNPGEIDCDQARLHLFSETDGWVELEPAVAIIRACQQTFGAGTISFAYYQTLHGERDAGTVTMVPGEDPEFFSLSRYMRDRLNPPPAPGTGVAPKPAPEPEMSP